MKTLKQQVVRKEEEIFELKNQLKKTTKILLSLKMYNPKLFNGVIIQENEKLIFNLK